MESPQLEGAPRDYSRGEVRTRRRSIVGPLLLISLGLLFLAQNLGFVSWSLWLSIWQFWPVVLILFGLEMILNRTSLGGALVTILLLLMLLAFAAVVGAFAFFMPIASTSSGYGGLAGPMVTEQMVKELDGAKRATVDLRHGAGRIVMEALPGDSMRLIEADLSYREGTTTLSSGVERRGDLAQISIAGRQNGGFQFGSGPREDWTVRLSQLVPMEVTVNSGASELDLDLGLLNVTRLNVESGASAVKVTTPEKGRTDAQIKTGASGVDVTIPEGVAARIRLDGGLTGSKVDEARFPKSGNRYQSPNYETAQNRLDLVIEAGVSGVTVR